MKNSNAVPCTSDTPDFLTQRTDEDVAFSLRHDVWKHSDINSNESRQICEEDSRNDLFTVYSNLHSDSSPESDCEIASFDDNLSDNGICENEQNQHEILAILDSSLEDTEDTIQNNPEKATLRLKTFLRNWTVTNGVKSCAVSDLLSHLKKYPCFSALPKDARTLLHTSRTCDVIDIEPGKYCHFGLTNGIIETLSNDNLKREKCKLHGVHIAVGIDGLPLSKSSTSTFWPILGSVFPNGPVFIIGVYHGNFKPDSSNVFLQQFVNEALLLYEHGIEIDDVIVPFSIKYFVLDAPAKSFVLNVKGHTGYNSCTKCHVKGLKSHGRVYFTEKNAKKRTNEEFRLHTDYTYHLGISPLERLPNIDLVKCISLDYMHLICLGVMRKLLYLWLRQNHNKRRKWHLSLNQIKHISNVLEDIRVPSEFSRKPRSLTFIKQWKATEYRQFLFYTRLIVLRNELREDLYQHFVTLHVAVRILASKDLHEHLNYAQVLLEHFVDSFAILYKSYLVSHNVHGLLHITEDVKHFGSIDNFSAFRFESFLYILKKLIRKSEKPLQQLFNRYNEIKHNKNKKAQNTTTCDKLVPVESSSYNDVVPDGCKNPLYKKAVCKTFTLSITDSANNCCGLEDGSIVIVQQILWHVQLNDFVITGKKFLQKRNVYNLPCASSLLNTYIVSTLSQNKMWPLSSVNKKFFILPYQNNNHVVVPLLHNENIYDI